jgi:putative RNA 2'-phosphotransferase
MVYILGHRPDEFGLVPDKEGFITYKELLWAIHEEPGWGYVRQGHINEVLMGKERDLFQSEDKQIRALDRRWHLDLHNPTLSSPKILFTPIRRKAHPFVMEKGLKSIEGRHIILTSDRDMATRIGLRRDRNPVLLEIMAALAQEKGIFFYPFGHLFLTTDIPVRFISGPPVSKEILATQRITETKKDDFRPGAMDFSPGTFTLDMNKDPDLSRRARGKKPKGWKESTRKMRKRKQ